jgi:hypothetical protein
MLAHAKSCRLDEMRLAEVIRLPVALTRSVPAIEATVLRNSTADSRALFDGERGLRLCHVVTPVSFCLIIAVESPTGMRSMQKKVALSKTVSVAALAALSCDIDHIHVNIMPDFWLRSLPPKPCAPP